MASTSTTKKVSFHSENAAGDAPGFVENSGSGLKKGVIVVQEWWGANEQIKTQAKTWFGHDFITIVPDLYRGKVTDDREEAGHLMNGLDFAGAVKDIRGAAKYLRDSEGCKHVGVVGFCMGGALSLAAAVHVKEVDAAAIFYGIPDGKFAPPSQVHCPLQLHFGELDTYPGFSDPKAASELETQLKNANIKHTFYHYKEVGHAFCNTTHTDPKEVAAAEVAKKRTQEFFAAKLA